MYICRKHLLYGLSLNWSWRNKIVFFSDSKGEFAQEFPEKENRSFLLLSIKTPPIPHEIFPLCIIFHAPSENPMYSAFHHKGPSSAALMLWRSTTPIGLASNKDSKSLWMPSKERIYLKDLTFKSINNFPAVGLMFWNTSSFIPNLKVWRSAPRTTFQICFSLAPLKIFLAIQILLVNREVCLLLRLHQFKILCQNSTASLHSQNRWQELSSFVLQNLQITSILWCNLVLRKPWVGITLFPISKERCVPWEELSISKFSSNFQHYCNIPHR